MSKPPNTEMIRGISPRSGKLIPLAAHSERVVYFWVHKEKAHVGVEKSNLIAPSVCIQVLEDAFELRPGTLAGILEELSTSVRGIDPPSAEPS